MLHKETVEPATLELLIDLLSIPELNNFALVGGTNLALRYGHRLSEDLDLFTNENFDLEEIVQVVTEKFPSIKIRVKKGQTFMSIINGIKIDIILHKYPYLEEVEIIDGIRMLSISDIIPMKLGALASRGVKKDFADIAYLLDFYSIEQMLGFYKSKYKNDDIGFIVHSLFYFNDAENSKEPVFLIPSTWEKIMKKIITATNNYIDNMSQ